MISKSTAQWMTQRELSNAIEASIRELRDLREAHHNNRGHGVDPKLVAAVMEEVRNFNVLTAEQAERNVQLLMDAFKDA